MLTQELKVLFTKGAKVRVKLMRVIFSPSSGFKVTTIKRADMLLLKK